MHPSPRRRNWLIPAIIAAVTFIGGVASNLLAGHFQDAVKPYMRWVWGVSAVALVVAIIAAIRGEKNPPKDIEASSTSATAQGSVATGAITNAGIVTSSENQGIHNSQVQGGLQMIERQEVHNYYHPGPQPPISPDQLSSQAFSQKAEASSSDAISKEGRQIFNLPFQRNRFFTGREQVLKRLYQNFTGGERVQSLNGLGGIGKTQTAVEYAYRHRQEYKAVLWVGANTRETLVADYAAIAGLLDLPEKNAQDQGETVAAVKRWLENNSDWLLILDNADEIKIAREFIPAGETGRILLTTRAHMMGAGGESNRIEKMPLEEGALFLLRRLRMLKNVEGLESSTLETYAQAKALSSLLDGLPLALDQAAAFIEETPSTLEQYQTLYQSERKELLKRRGRLAEDHPSVAVTFSLAFKKVADDNPVAADLLRVCAFLEADSIPEEILAVSANKVLFENSRVVLSRKLSKIRLFRIFFGKKKNRWGKALSSAAESPLALTYAIGEAARFSLLQRHSEARTVSLHRLVQAVLKDEMDSDTRRMWAERAVRGVNEVFPEGEYSDWATCDRLIPHAQSLALVIDEYGFDFPEAARLLNQAGYYLNQRARYTDAEPLYQRALAIYEKAFGPEHPDTATILNNLAGLYESQGRYDEAESLLKRALDIREKTLGPQHPDTATCLNDLALLYNSQGRYDEAEPLFQRALDVYEKALGPEHPHTATCLNNLAGLYKSQGRYDEAESLLKRALDIREKALGPQHPDTATILNNLAFLYSSQGRYAKAEPILKRALDIREKAFGPQHPDIATCLNNLAALYNSQGRYAKAEPLFQRALDIYERALGPQHPDTATSLNNLAFLYKSQGRYDEAEPLFQRALDVYEKALSPEHPDTATCLNNLAGLYNSQERYDEAEPILKRALDIREKALGPEHPFTARVLKNYAALIRKLNRKTEAAKLEARAKEIREKTDRK